MRIAVNVPYFVPYSGYFRLFASTDLFVLFDCVPFPRRGYVHRNQLPNLEDEAAWFTLPLNKVPRDTCIKDMTFVDDIEAAIEANMRRFPVLLEPGVREHPLVAACLTPADSLVDYIENTLRVTTSLLDLPCNIIRSSNLPVDSSLKGEARVLHIVEHLGGTEYINAPGGRHLYDNDRFMQKGIRLRYLEPWLGSHWSILYRLLTEPVADIRQQIIEQSIPPWQK